MSRGGKGASAAMSLEAKWQLIHTNGIWMEVEGVREEPGPASRKRSSLSTAAATFHHTAAPRYADQRALTEPLPHREHAQALLPAPGTPGS